MHFCFFIVLYCVVRRRRRLLFTLIWINPWCDFISKDIVVSSGNLFGCEIGESSDIFVSVSIYFRQSYRLTPIIYGEKVVANKLLMPL